MSAPVRPTIDALEAHLGTDPFADPADVFGLCIAEQRELIAYIRHLEAQRAELLPWAWAAAEFRLHGGDINIPDGASVPLPDRLKVGEFGPLPEGDAAWPSDA